MERRKFMIGAGSTAIGASAIVGSGAFSRVESERSVTVEVASDSDAYLRMAPIESSANSGNFVEEDDYGHLEIDIGDFDPNGDKYSYETGQGVNSNSLTFFDDLFEVCNQGKADARFYIDTSGLLDDVDEGDIQFYTGTASGSQGTDGIDPIGSGLEDDSREIKVGGDCVNVGLLVDTGKGSDHTEPGGTVDATEVETLVDGEVTIVADAEGDAGA